MKLDRKTHRKSEIDRLKELVLERSLSMGDKEEIIMLGFENDIMSSTIADFTEVEPYKITRYRKRFITGKQVFFKNKTKLSEKEEKKVIKKIKERFEDNKLTTPEIFLSICEKIVRKRPNHENIKFSKKFYESFLLRHKELKIKLIQHVNIQRLRAANINNLTIFLKNYNFLFEKNRYNENLVFNYDETMLQLNFSGKTFNCIIPEGMKEKDFLSKNISFKHFTLGYCVGRSGLSCKPLLIYPSKKKKEIFYSPFIKWFPSHSDSGWINNEILLSYFENIFIEKVKKIRGKLNSPNSPCLLIMDGHSTRKNSILRQKLRSKNIDILILPSNSSSFLQPLDLSVNPSFKKNLFKELSSFEDKSTEISLSKKTDNFVLKSLPDLIYSSLSPKIIKSGWSQTKLNHDVLTEPNLLGIRIVKQSSSMTEYHPIRVKLGSISGQFINP